MFLGLSKILLPFRLLFPGKPHFSADDIVPDLTDKVVIVTGANTGEGLVVREQPSLLT